MLSFRFTRTIIASAFVAAIPFVVEAQERQLGSFTGRVDKEVRITMHGGDVSSSTLSGADLRSRYRAQSALPLEEGTVRVALNNGRGDVSVIQQPNASNGYTAIIRIFDRSSGADVYRFSTYFTPQSNMQVGRGGGIMGRGRRGNVPTLHWSGDVDGTVELRWRGENVNQRIINGNALRGANSSVSGDLSRLQNGQNGQNGQYGQNGQSGQNGQYGQVSVALREGRGQVTVLQQPTAQNRYTTVVRISDPARGYGHYDFDAILR